MNSFDAKELNLMVAHMKHIFTSIFFLGFLLSLAQKTDTIKLKEKQPNPKEKEYMSIDEYERKYNSPTLEVFTIAEVMPEFPGGNDSMSKFIKVNIKYPQKAKADKVGGKCLIKFIVLNNGSITDAKIDKGVDGCSECDVEALRVILLMPKWKPGKINGKIVDVYYILPIHFQP